MSEWCWSCYRSDVVSEIEGVVREISVYGPNMGVCNANRPTFPIPRRVQTTSKGNTMNFTRKGKLILARKYNEIEFSYVVYNVFDKISLSVILILFEHYYLPRHGNNFYSLFMFFYTPRLFHHEWYLILLYTFGKLALQNYRIKNCLTLLGGYTYNALVQYVLCLFILKHIDGSHQESFIMA